jgi:hypothetical protein
MEDDSFMEHIHQTPSNDNLFQDPDSDDDDDDSFIPDSLKGFLEAADKKLQADLDDVLASDYKPKNVPNVNANANAFDDHDDDHDDEGTNAIFMDMLKAEQDESLKRSLMRSRNEEKEGDMQQVVSDDEDHHAINPAANLTARQAKDEAMDGMSPMSPTNTNTNTIKGTRLEFSNPKEESPPPLERTTPSPTKKPKLDEQYEDELPEQERSYISSSSSSSSNDQPKPISPPAIVYNHHHQQKQQRQPPSPEVPSSAELLRQALQVQKEVKAKLSPTRGDHHHHQQQQQSVDADAVTSNLLDYLHPNINNNNNNEKEERLESPQPTTNATPPPKAAAAAPQPPRPEESASPSGMVSNLLEYLHPTTNNNNQKTRTRHKPESKPQQLFKVPPPSNVKHTTPSTSHPVSEVTIPSASSSTPTTNSLRIKRQQQLQSPGMNTTTTTFRQQGHSPIGSPRPRRQLTEPDKNIPSRLLQATRVGRNKSKPMPEQPTRTRRRTSSSRSTGFMQSTQASSGGMASTTTMTTTVPEKEKKPVDAKAKARIRARLESTKTSSSRREIKAQQKQRVKSTLEKVRERRERLERMEQERVAKLKAKIDEREQKAQERRERLAQEKKAASPRRTRTARQSLLPRVPTIPKTPNFRTDSRLKGRETREEIVPLAASKEVFIKSFREDQSADGSAAHPRKLTIPKTPKLAMAQKYGKKSVTAADGDDDSVGQWQSGLRSETSPSNWSTNSGLTIPKTPNFQHVRKRELPKSTAEKEQEEMEYYKAHPFKARQIEMNKRSTARSKKSFKPRQLTVPKPFSLSSRTQSSPEKKNEEQPKPRQFKARPTPSFPAAHGTPVSGFTMKTKRGLTTAKPFKLSGSTRNVTSPPASSEPEKEHKFKAREMPAFSSASSGPPKSITLRNTASWQSREPEKEKKFRARPMPKFDRVGIPVVSRNRNKLRSPPSNQKEETNQQFRAKGVPKYLSKPSSIPVRKRDPTKLRSPDYVKTSPEYTMKKNGGTNRLSVSPEPRTFQAKPAPLRSPPHIPPTILRNSPSKIRSPARKFEARPEPGTFHAKPAPLRSPPHIPVQDRDPTILRNSPSKTRSPARKLQARPAPYRSPPDIPVRQRVFDQLKVLSSPTKQPERELPAPPSLAGSSSASSTSVLQPRVDKKQAVRDNLRQRMRGKTGTKQSTESFSTADSSRIGASVESSMASSGESSSAYDYSTSKNDFAQVEGGARNIGAQLKSDIAQADAEFLLANQKLEKLAGAKDTLLHTAMNMWPHREEAPSDPQLKPEQKTPVTKGARDTAELNVAMGGWLCDAIATTPRTGNAPAKVFKMPKSQKKTDKKTDKMSETRRLEQEAFMVHDPDEYLPEQTRSQVYEETTRLAADLQRTAEDELSFEASLNSKDNLDEGFIGQPTSGHGQFSL